MYKEDTSYDMNDVIVRTITWPSYAIAAIYAPIFNEAK